MEELSQRRDQLPARPGFLFAVTSVASERRLIYSLLFNEHQNDQEADHSAPSRIKI
jgi:hypothetical protein